MSKLSDEERRAFEIVGACLDVDVTQWDTGAKNRQGVYDARIVYPDGHEAALEVVESTSQQKKQLDSAIRRLGYRLPVPGLGAGFMAMLPPDVLPVGRSGQKLISVARWMMQGGYSSLSVLNRFGNLPDDVEWAIDRGVGLWVNEGDGVTSDQIVLFGYGVGGFPDNNLSGLAEDLDEVLSGPVMVRHLEKMARADLPERHLFILVDLIGLAPRSFLALTGGQIPALPLNPIGYGVTNLWLCPNFPQKVYMWDVTVSTWSTFAPFQ